MNLLLYLFFSFKLVTDQYFHILTYLSFSGISICDLNLTTLPIPCLVLFGTVEVSSI